MGLLFVLIVIAFFLYSKNFQAEKQFFKSQTY